MGPRAHDSKEPLIKKDLKLTDATSIDVTLRNINNYDNWYWHNNKLIWHWPNIMNKNNKIRHMQYQTMSTWWRHQMETFSALLALCAGNSPATGEFPPQRPVTRSFDVFLDLRLNNDCVNNREAGDLRRYRGHYDVIVMKFCEWALSA